MKNLKGSLYVGQVYGIKMYVHWTFFLLLAWIFFSYYGKQHSLEQGMIGVLFILSLFACVVLHEFGHILTARRFGYKAKNITLLPIGGLANMERIPEKPIQEFWMALAGPWVNVVIAAAIFLFISIRKGVPSLTDLDELKPSNFLLNLMVTNVALAVFNLIPAFPMDGGRVFRSLLAMRMDRVRATRIAANVGQVMAVVFVALGIFFNFWLIFIGIFIFIGAGAEASFEVTKSILRHHRVKDIVMKQYTPLHPQDTLGKAAHILLNGQEKDFLVVENGQVAGILTRTELIRGLSEQGNESPVSVVMKKHFLSLEAGMHLEEVLQKMTAAGETICPVFEHGQLLGALDMENINELVLVDGAMKGTGQARSFFQQQPSAGKA